SQVNPGGTSTVSVSASTFSGTDADGTIGNIRITSFPTNTTTIILNGTSYSSGTFPAGGVTLTANSSGQPTQSISVDPIDGAVNVVISYVTIDNATKEDPSAGTATVPFTNPAVTLTAT